VSNYDPIDTASQDKARADRASREKLADQADVDDVKWLMSSKRGRRILWRILERGEVFKLSFNTNSMSMAFSEGRKNEGLRVLALIHAAAPELYATMLKEARE
jgi:hypothetical protein